MRVNEKALKFYRKKSMLSQKDMANKLNISLSLYQSFEQGRRNPSYKIIKDIADILKINKYAIFDSRIMPDVDIEVENKINLLAEKQIKAKKLLSELKQIVVELEDFLCETESENIDK